MIDPSGPKPKIEELAKLPHGELALRFKVGIEHFDARVTKLTDAQLDTAFRADAGVGLWPCRVLLGHIADADLSYVQRLRRVVAEEKPILQAWDEQAFIDNGLYGSPANGARYPIGAFLATVHTLRQWTGEWLGTLPPDAFKRIGLHTERGEMSLRLLLEYATWHIEHHAWYLNAKVRKLVG